MDQEQEEKKEKERNSGLSVMRHVGRTKGATHGGNEVWRKGPPTSGKFPIQIQSPFKSLL